MNFKGVLAGKDPLNRDRTSKLLFFSLILFLVLAPLLENRGVGKIVLILNLYVTLVTSTMELAGRRVLFWSAIPLAACSMVLLLASNFHRTPFFLMANSLVFAAFLILVSVSLFTYLGEDGAFTSGRLYASVSLYFLLGVSWFAIYNVINLLQPGSFAEAGVPLPSDVHWSTFLYFSLTTLTTLGYGDVVAVKPEARMVATLEAAIGLLYVAITVARLVASSHTEKTRDQL
jgi:Ion channel